MNKVWIVAGVILCIVLLLGAWVFLGDFSNFAKRLGSEGKDIALGDQNTIVGTWVLNGTDCSITFLSNGGYTSTLRHYGAGTYFFEDGTLVFNIEISEINGDSEFTVSEMIFDYDFFDDNTLILIDNEDGTSEVFKKQ
jgi:hypothetical protein